MKSDNIINVAFIVAFLLIFGGVAFSVAEKARKTDQKVEAKVEAKVETPINSVPGYDFIESKLLNDLNTWRQKNYDKHVISFCETIDGFIIHWVSNPGNSRQIFVFEEENILYHVKRMEKFQNKYPNHEIIDVSCLNDKWGYILLLQDKLEPYQPSVQ